MMMTQSDPKPEIKPTMDHLNDPYVLQLIEALARRDDEIERLRAEAKEQAISMGHLALEVGRLRAALEPFAKAHKAMNEPNRIIDPYEHITLHDLRVASEALGNDDE